MKSAEERATEKIQEMIELSNIKDGEEYVPGVYNQRSGKSKTGQSGFYIKAKHNSILSKIEKFTVGKFRLEYDTENFQQDALVETWLSLVKYYTKYGVDCERDPDGWVCQDVKYKMMDKAKLAKSNVSVCDRKTGEYHIMDIESFEQKFIEENDKTKNQRDEKFLSVIYNVPVDYKFIENTSSNKFIQWFHNNKDFILTKKQLKWLNGEIIINDMSGIWRLKKNILKKVEQAYNEDRVKGEKIGRLNKYLKSIAFLLDFKDEDDIKYRLHKITNRKDNAVIIDIYKELDMYYCETLTSIISQESAEGLEEIQCDKNFYYAIIDILINKETYANDLIKNIQNGVIE